MEGLLIIGLLYLASAIFGRVVKESKQGGAKSGRPRPARRPSSNEAERLQDLLERLGIEVPQVPPTQPEWGPEEEPGPRVVSLEVPPDRPFRVVLSQDDEAGRIITRRLHEAEARSGALTDADHDAFDRRIRQRGAGADAPARRLPQGRLREAVIWREILGPPVSLNPEHGTWDA